jgi:hypothetical protein
VKKADMNRASQTNLILAAVIGLLIAYVYHMSSNVRRSRADVNALHAELRSLRAAVAALTSPKPVVVAGAPDSIAPAIDVEVVPAPSAAVAVSADAIPRDITQLVQCVVDEVEQDMAEDGSVSSTDIRRILGEIKTEGEAAAEKDSGEEGDSDEDDGEDSASSPDPTPQHQADAHDLKTFSEEELRGMLNESLRQYLRENNASTFGSKDALIKRIQTLPGGIKNKAA